MAIIYNDTEPRQPENVALSFSGGGFRATAYGLGCLSYMERVNLGSVKMTDRVRFVSAASGGTFTALAWVRSKYKSQLFPDFYHGFIKEALSGERLIEHAFRILKDPGSWKARPDKSRNLINAFAIAYDEIIFKGDNFGIYYGPADKHLPGICANTTEFDNGEQFRFQNIAVAGNKFLKFKADDLSQHALKSLKLGDILACSSCFTGGFEPIVYPRDFTYNELTRAMLSNAIISDSQFNPMKADETPAPVCFDLMDGGIDDNQGINSFMLAEERLQNENQFGYDIYLACDVSSDYSSGFEFPAEKGSNLFSRLSPVNYALMLGIFLVLSVTLIFFPDTAVVGAIATGSFGILMAAAMTVYLLGDSAMKKGSAQKNTFALIGRRFISIFLNLPLYVLKPMFTSRGSSTGYLATTVFLKKIRRISYDRLFEKVSEHRYAPDGSLLREGADPTLTHRVDLKHWSRFSLQNAIYLLSKKNNKQRHTDLAHEKWFKNPPILSNNDRRQSLTDWMNPTVGIQETASRATAMETTLWFDQNQQRDKILESIIATGQFTTCYNLLRYVYRFPTDDPYWKHLQDELLSDWCLFLDDPLWLEKQYANKSAAFPEHADNMPFV